MHLHHLPKYNSLLYLLLFQYHRRMFSFICEKITQSFYAPYGEGALHGGTGGELTCGAGQESIFIGGGRGTGLYRII